MNILKSMWTYQCPKCRSSKMFKEPLQISNPLDMHEECSVCQQKFNPEPGFYFGAMFLSYILSAWFLLLPALALVFLFDWSVNGAMLFVLALAAVTYLKFLRFSRSLWIHIVVKYDKTYSKKK
jgi:uncharacterized protein (DUF983 family)